MGDGAKRPGGCQPRPPIFPAVRQPFRVGHPPRTPGELLAKLTEGWFLWSAGLETGPRPTRARTGSG